MAHQRVGHAITFRVEHQQVAVMDESVDHRGSHLFVGKYTSPFGKLQIGGEYQTFAFIAVGDYAEQQL